EQHRGLSAQRELHVSWPGAATDPPLHQRLAVRGFLYLEPQHRRQHGPGVRDVADTATAAGLPAPGERPLILRARPASPLHFQHDLRCAMVQEQLELVYQEYCW